MIRMLKRKLQLLFSPQRKQLNPSLILIAQLYKNTYPENISKLERTRLGLDADNFIYGEIIPFNFLKILQQIPIHDNEVFVDLGSGAGKAVFTAALNFNFKEVVGIEYLPALAQINLEKLTQAKTLIKNTLAGENDLEKLSKIKIINADFLTIEFSYADIIFINATCLSYTCLENLYKKFLMLKAGTRIIITSKRIKNENFQLISENLVLMSWGMCSILIYVKT